MMDIEKYARQVRGGPNGKALDELARSGGGEKLLTGVDGEKNTFLRLYGVDACQEMVERLTREAVAALEPFPDRAEMTALAQKLTTRRS